MSLIPDIDYKIIETSTLQPLVYDSYYDWSFPDLCLDLTASTSFTFCNLTSDPLTFDITTTEGPGPGENGQLSMEWPLTGLTIAPFGTYTFNLIFKPIVESNHQLFIDFSGETFHTLFYVDGNGWSNKLNIPPDDCWLNFGPVALTDTVTTYFNLQNWASPLYVTFSGSSSDFGFNNPYLLDSGYNSIPIIFNPQTFGPISADFLLLGDCSPHLATFCGEGVIGSGVNLQINNNNLTYVGCCNTLSLEIFNNRIYTNEPIIITGINYPQSLTTDQNGLPLLVNKGTCYIIDFVFCPNVSGLTDSEIVVQYLYQVSGTEFTGNSIIHFTLNAVPHPFTTIGLDCVSFNCQSSNNERTINITNAGNLPFEFYYNYSPVGDYNYGDIFVTQPDSPVIIPPYITTGLTIDFNSYALTTGSSYNGVFNLNFVDPNCCKEFSKCVTINFCPTTINVSENYPKNVSCYGGNDGEYVFSVNDCSGGYHITWSSDTMSSMSQYDDQVSATDLYAGNYLLTIVNACSATTYHNFTIGQPEALFVDITWKNPANYCKKDLASLCGIVPDPNLNPSGYVVIDKETLINVINNDVHDIPGQTKRGYQQYDARENEVAQGIAVSPINSFRNYILNFFSGTFAKYKTKWTKEEIITLKSWDDIVSDTLGQGCCFASFVSGGTSPYTYQWTGPNGYSEISPNIYNRPCCEPYTLWITDAHGCQMSATSTCLKCTFGIEDLIQTNPTCSESNDGEIYVSVTGDCLNSAFEIELESDIWIGTYTAATHNFINLSKGNYILRITNLETACKLDPINITLRPKYEFYVEPKITGTTCEQSCNGALEVIVHVTNNEDHVDPQFLYTLDGQYQNSNIFTGLCVGNYELNVLNTINYCELTQEITIPNWNLFNVRASSTPSSNIDVSDGTITITVTNGLSLCDGYECYELIDEGYVFDSIPNSLFYSEEEECIFWSEDEDCPIDVEPDYDIDKPFIYSERNNCEIVTETGCYIEPEPFHVFMLQSEINGCTLTDESGLCFFDAEQYVNGCYLIIQTENECDITNEGGNCLINSEKIVYPRTSVRSEITECEILSENNNCIIALETWDAGCNPLCQYDKECNYYIPCNGLTTFINHQFTITNVHAGRYCFTLRDGNGCIKSFCVTVGFTRIKKKINEVGHFDSKRIDIYGGSKVIGNTPKGQ